jgi:DNA-binding response OmpR family regulator
MARILCIDDDARLRRVLTRVLEHDGHVVATAATAIAGLELAAAQRWDLIVLDLMLPDMPGTAVLGALMDSDSEQRVLVLSGVGDTDSRVACLERGAVDYVGKPFEVRELRARVLSRLRDAPRAKATVVVSTSGMQLDTLKRKLRFRGEVHDLSTREFLLIEYLMRHPNSVCTREELLSEVWGYAFDPGSNVVDVAVGRLRQKLGDGTIHTIRNVGYALAV